MATPKLMLFDGHGLAYRAFYALPALSSSKGVPVHAVLGVANMVLKVLDREGATHAAFSFDVGVPPARLEAFAHYKAQRERMPESLEVQLDLIRRLVALMGFPVVELEGYEADDCIATIVTRLAEEPVEVLIVTGDQDLLQLASDQVKILVTTKGTSEITAFTPELVRKKFGLGPEQLADYKGLAGDSSDNIPGVAGIGPKTAQTLLARFGSIEGIYEHLEEVTPEKVRLALAMHKEDAFLSRQLATLVRDAPAAFSLEGCRRPERYPEELREFLEDLELKNLLGRLGLARGGEADSPATGKGVVTVSIVETGEISDEVVGRLAIGMVALAGDPAKGEIAVAGSDEMVHLVHSARLESLVAAFSRRNPPPRLVLHDLKGWLRALPALETGLMPLLAHDTMLAAFLTNPTVLAPSPAQVAREHLGRDLPPRRAGELGERDALAAEAVALRDAAPLLEAKLEAAGLTGLYRSVELPLPPVLARMEATGVVLSGDYLRELAKELDRDLAAITQKAHRLAGEEFNLASNKQLGEILYEKLGLPTGRKIKTGYSTDSDELARLAKHSEIAVEILAFRELSKLKNTYVDQLPSLLDPATGRLHTSFHQAVTATGRLSSSNPNLQNIPIRTELGRRIRCAFTAPPGSLLLSIDYSQIELRVLAHMSGDPALTEAFRNDADIHARTAAELYGVPADQVTAEMRRAAKVVNFGILYGMTEHGLSLELGCSRDEARLFIARYFERFAGVKSFLERVLEEARSRGFVVTMHGRKRWLPEITSRNRMVREMAERMAVNTPVQGTAAEIIKLAMIAIHRRLGEAGLSGRMIVQVHDELLFEAPREELGAVARLAKREMESVIPFAVPLKVDMEVGSNWAETSPMTLAALP